MKDLRDKLKDNPFTYLHIIHPDLGSKKIHKAEGEARFKMVRERYEEFKQDGIFFRENKPCFYIYRQTKNGHPFTGIMAAVAVQDYLEGKIKIHEHTLAKREATFTHYLETTGINAEPVLLISEDSASLQSFFSRYTDHRSEYDFSTTNKVRHQLWVVDLDEDIRAIEAHFERTPHLYIADGHHRTASSAALYSKWIASGKIDSPDHPANYFMAFILDESTVRIYEFNRLVKDLNGLSSEEFLNKLRVHFEIIHCEAEHTPARKGEFALTLGKNWYSLVIREAGDELDSDLLTDIVLQPILGIGDLRKDKRIAFMEGPRGLHALQLEVEKGKFAAGFALFPVSGDELKSFADHGKCMPPKSTWVEPKLRSGLLIHELA